MHLIAFSFYNSVRICLSFAASLLNECVSASTLCVYVYVGMCVYTGA